MPLRVGRRRNDSGLPRGATSGRGCIGRGWLHRAAASELARLWWDWAGVPGSVRPTSIPSSGAARGVLACPARQRGGGASGVQGAWRYPTAAVPPQTPPVALDPCVVFDGSSCRPWLREKGRHNLTGDVDQDSTQLNVFACDAAIPSLSAAQHSADDPRNPAMQLRRSGRQPCRPQMTHREHPSEAVRHLPSGPLTNVSVIRPGGPRLHLGAIRRSPHECTAVSTNVCADLGPA